MTGATPAVPPTQRPLSVGDLAPDFELEDQHGQSVALSSYRGRSAVLLVFYPYAFTSVCNGELHDLQDNLASLRALGAEVIALSVDSRYSQRTFADREGFSYRILADFWPHGGVATLFGVLDDTTGAAHRATFLIDQQQRIGWLTVTSIGQARDPQDYLQAITRLRH